MKTTSRKPKGPPQNKIYCPRCKTLRNGVNITNIVNRMGKKAIKAKCEICGLDIMKFL